MQEGWEGRQEGKEVELWCQPHGEFWSLSGFFRIVLTLAEIVRPLNPVYLSHYVWATLGK